MFVHIRGRSTYSFLEGIGSLNQIFSRAQELEQSAIALTDLNGMYGIVDFYNKSKTFNIKPLVGVEMSYTPYYANSQKIKGLDYIPTLTFLASNLQWYHNLLRLVSQWYKHCQDDVPVIDNEIIQEYREGLIVIIGWLTSYAYYLLALGHDKAQFERHIDEMVGYMWVDNVVIDITAQLYTHYPYLKSVNDAALHYARTHNLFVTTSNEYYYPLVHQKWPYETALAIRDGKKIYDPDARKIVWQHYIMSESEISDVLRTNGFDDTTIRLLIDNTGVLTDRCDTKITLGQALFPNYDTPDDIRLLYENYRNEMVIPSVQ